jgi:hypothetical protein
MKLELAPPLEFLCSEDVFACDVLYWDLRSLSQDGLQLKQSSASVCNSLTLAQIEIFIFIRKVTVFTW